MGEWSGMWGRKGLDHSEFRHPFLMEQGSDQPRESVAWFRFIEPGGTIHFGFGDTSGPTFPIQTSRQIQMKPIEIHHQFSCCFRQRGKGNVRSMVTAGNRRYCSKLQAGLLDRLQWDFLFAVGIRQTTIRERLGKIDSDRECFRKISIPTWTVWNHACCKENTVSN